MTRLRKERKVWVVMANDLPDAVWDSEEAAETYCLKMNRASKEMVEKYKVGRIYYRWYGHFVLTAADARLSVKETGNG